MLSVLARRNRLQLEKEKKKANKASTRQGKSIERKRLRVETSDDIEDDKQYNWKKRSIFWDMPYWEYLLIRHNLGGMHTEKNFCDKLLFTVLCDKVRSKDNFNSRLDL